MIPAGILAEIMRRLARAEQEEGVRIVLAIESGSRAWGFASPDSDFDVRFIYVREPDSYLAIDLEEQRDVIEYPITDDIDLNGWDIRKALRLFWKSNPTFIEWIQSPIVYIEAGGFAQGARRVLSSLHSSERGIHHYRSMAKTNYRGYLRAEMVPLKKYFYVLRPLLAVRWIERYDTAPPIEFSKLLHLIDDRSELLADVHALLQKKSTALERGLSEPIGSINAFVEAESERLEGAVPRDSTEPLSVAQLNELFHVTLREQRALAGP